MSTGAALGAGAVSIPRHRLQRRPRQKAGTRLPARLGHGVALGISRREAAGQIGDDDAEGVLVVAGFNPHLELAVKVLDLDGAGDEDSDACRGPVHVRKQRTQIGIAHQQFLLFQ